ncbi:MAG: PadR family transcriptional regulator [Acidimicrobiales bacterium]
MPKDTELPNDTDPPKWEAPARANFDLAPPRHFLYPAILLMLAEEPRHGYRLVDALLSLGYGPVSRPSIYRALGELQHDGLMHSWTTDSTAGSPRQVYELTDKGTSTLESWMGVILVERDCLDRILARYAKVIS